MTSQQAWALHRTTSYLSGLPDQPRVVPETAPDSITLPDCEPLSLRLDDALLRRGSCRRFSGSALRLQTVATLLSAAYGCGQAVKFGDAGWPARPVPSAGAKYPLELHLVVRAVDSLPEGSYRYLPKEHALAPTGPSVSFSRLADIFFRQPYLAPAAAIVVIAGNFEPTTARYGLRGYRYVLFEAGHVAQNLLLAATALGAGSLSLGGFLDDMLANTLQVGLQVAPLYGVALGQPADSDRDVLRQID
jgi:SagB-type dehydrogenase family enzyme